MQFLRPLLVVAIALVATVAASAQSGGEASLDEVLDATGARLEWDAYSGSGLLLRDGRSLAFTLDSKVAIEDFEVVHRTGGVRRDGQGLAFADDFLQLARRLFPPPELGRRIGAIFIDPGHGGRDPGAIGVHDGGSFQLQEKDVVLDVALLLRERLEAAYPDRSIVVSRSDDRYLTLEDRTNLANGIETGPNESVIFISIHANASLNRNARGFEVWFLPPEFRRRNLVDAAEVGVEDPDVLSILNTIREEEITIESVLLARNVLAGMASAIGDQSPNRGLREESWYVVRNAIMPSILVEVGFVTNAVEAQRLANREYLLRVTDGIYSGVRNFIRSFENVGLE